MTEHTRPKRNWKELPPEQIAALMNRKSEGYLTGLMGFTLISVSKERVLARMEIEKRHMAPNGYLHAASVVALADSTCGFAVSMYLPEGAEGFTTIEQKPNFLGTARSGFILCEGTPAHMFACRRWPDLIPFNFLEEWIPTTNRFRPELNS